MNHQPLAIKILISPDSFKGSLTATQAAEAIAAGVRRALPDAGLVLIPLADGGEGTVEALVNATGGRVVHTPATDPLGNKIESFFGTLGDGESAVVEMAAASGLPLVPDDLRNPMLTTTYGTGELIRAALDAGCRKVILGIGGSATNDGGVGAIQALGGSFRDADGREVGFGGGELIRISLIDLSGLDPRLKETDIVVACDVDNPLTGPRGASAVFGPQKGATPEMVQELDAGLKNLAEVIRRDMGIDVEHLPGAGAAGGLGAASVAFLGARLKSGIDIVLEATHFADELQGASLVITGEGKIDAQTLQGKTVMGVLRAARSAGVPALALGGSVEPEGRELLKHGATAVLPIVTEPMPLQEAFARAGELLADATEQALARFIQRF
jgi:glycerate 2-kinase